MSVITKFIFASFFLLLVPFFVSAATITPTSADLHLDQGETGIVSFGVLNISDESIKYTVDLIGIELGDGKDDLSFIDLTDEVSFELSEIEFTVEPEQGRELKLAVKPNQSMESKVIVVGVRVLEIPVEDENIVVATGTIGLLFLTVGNDVREDVELLDFSSSRTFVSSLPLEFYTTLRNNGERIVQPTGFLVLNNLFGKEVAKIEINTLEKRVPAEQERTFVTRWGDGSAVSGFFSKMSQETVDFKLGSYRAHLELVPWDGGEPISASKTIIIFPWRTSFAFFGILLVLVGLIYFTRKR